MKKENVIQIEAPELKVKYATIFIKGDGDLVLNQMCARAVRTLTSEREDKNLTREVANQWEDIITSIKWFDDLSVTDTYKECNEKLYHELLRKNKPCITAFGLKKSFGDAVIRNEIDTYRTKFDNAMNVIAPKGLVPIKFTAASIDERLMQPKKGKPVLVQQ